MIEVLIVIGVVAAIGIFVAPNLFNSKNSRDVNNTVTQIVTVLRDAQSRSATQTQGTSWGVYFSNATDTPAFFALYSGSYSSTTVVNSYLLPRNICYSSLAQGATSTVIFNQISGIANASMAIVLATNSSGACNQNGAVTTWGNTSAFSIPSSSIAYGTESSAISNGYIYRLNPIRNQSSTYYAPINNDGTIGAWATTTPMLWPLIGPVISYNGYLYAIGGTIGAFGQVVNYYGKVNSNGTIDSWSAAANDGASVLGHAVVTYNGYIYKLGGVTNLGNAVKTVNYAAIGSDGSLGTWSATTQLPRANDQAGAVAYEGYLYYIGGNDANGPLATSTVYSAPINGDGSLGSWSRLSSLPAATLEVGTTINNGYVYALGGVNGGGAFSKTGAYAPLNASGTIASWTTISGEPAYAVSQNQLLSNNGFFYIITDYTQSGGIGPQVFMSPAQGIVVVSPTTIFSPSLSVTN